MKPAGQIRPLPRRRKASIEIYFVLYLSAIILLLGTTPSRQHDDEAELEQAILHLLAPDFRVRVEKSALLYSFIPAGITLDTVGANLRRDSMNLVVARGRFSSVRFSIVAIEDSGTGETLPPEAHARLVRRDDRTALFQWKPMPSDRNTVYRVTVVGTAIPLPPADMKPELRKRVTDVMERYGTVSDSVTFTVNTFALRDQSMVRRVALLQTPTLGRGADADTSLMASSRADAADPFSFGTPFELQTTTLEVPAVQGGIWRNRVTLSGNASFNDLRLQVEPPGVQVTSKTPTMIELSGSAPMTGELPVRITARRDSDGRTGTINFVVRSAKLPPPDIARSMFVGQSYRLDFSAPGIPDGYIAVEVVENDKVVVSRNDRRALVVYQPSASGRVNFIRYLNGQRLDATDAELRPLPLPVVQAPKRQSGSNEVMVTTVAYGMVGGMPNRCRLHVLEGNASDPEQMDLRYDEKSKTTTQIWKLRPRSVGEEFWFRIYALDQRGSGSGKSTPQKYSMDAFGE